MSRLNSLLISYKIFFLCCKILRSKHELPVVPQGSDGIPGHACPQKSKLAFPFSVEVSKEYLSEDRESGTQQEELITFDLPPLQCRLFKRFFIHLFILHLGSHLPTPIPTSPLTPSLPYPLPILQIPFSSIPIQERAGLP